MRSGAAARLLKTAAVRPASVAARNVTTAALQRELPARPPPRRHRRRRCRLWAVGLGGRRLHRWLLWHASTVEDTLQLVLRLSKLQLCRTSLSCCPPRLTAHNRLHAHALQPHACASHHPPRSGERRVHCHRVVARHRRRDRQGAGRAGLQGGGQLRGQQGQGCGFFFVWCVPGRGCGGVLCKLAEADSAARAAVAPSQVSTMPPPPPLPPSCVPAAEEVAQQVVSLGGEAIVVGANMGKVRQGRGGLNGAVVGVPRARSACWAAQTQQQQRQQQRRRHETAPAAHLLAHASSPSFPLAARRDRGHVQGGDRQVGHRGRAGEQRGAPGWPQRGSKPSLCQGWRSGGAAWRLHLESGLQPAPRRCWAGLEHWMRAAPAASGYFR